MSKQRDRDEFIALMTKEDVPVAVARLVMRHGATLQRLAELECSSEAAARDRVPCPAEDASHAQDCIRRQSPAAECSCFKASGRCLCRGYGSFQGDTDDNLTGEHGDVPRIAVKADRLERLVAELLKPYGVGCVFNGDPRGAVVKLTVPSGITNDWGKEGVCVP